MNGHAKHPLALCSAALCGAVIAGCSSPDQSLLIYQLPYRPGETVDIWQDHLTHSPALEIDMAGVDGVAPYTVVAAQDGTIRLIEDGLGENCCGGTCGNNYVWIEHIGGEWTKYSHLAQGSVTGAGHVLDGPISRGQLLGLESNVGRACGTNNGRHLHFEVRRVTDPTSPDLVGDLSGEKRLPRFCGVANQTVVQDEQYVVTACPG